jgi:hypothetical protein
MWWPAVAKAEWRGRGGGFPTQPGQRPVTTWVYKPEASDTCLELLMMSGGPLETCWDFNKLWNNKFYYKAASCWYFYWIVYDARIHEYQKAIGESVCKGSFRNFIMSACFTDLIKAFQFQSFVHRSPAIVCSQITCYCLCSQVTYYCLCSQVTCYCLCSQVTCYCLFTGHLLLSLFTGHLLLSLFAGHLLLSLFAGHLLLSLCTGHLLLSLFTGHLLLSLRR